jgi:hypothetical protein
MMQAILAVLSGGLVGFSLGLIGGGGSILATPLLLYVVGVQNPHVAIGTGALAVGLNAFTNFIGHARSRTVLWRSATLFAAIGVIGATLGSAAGKAFDGKRLLFLFAILMVVVGVMMLRRRHLSSDAAHVERLDMAGVAKIAGAALLVGALAGFFGIGGGFLIVPGLIFATGMPMINAIGSSLLSVGSFGATTAVNYALSGLVAWVLAAEFIGGGVVGGLLGMRLALRLASRRAALTRIFVGVIFIVAAYMLYRNAAALGIG